MVPDPNQKIDPDEMSVEAMCDRWRWALAGQFGETVEVLPSPKVAEALAVRWEDARGPHCFQLWIRHLGLSNGTISAVRWALQCAVDRVPHDGWVRCERLTYAQVLALPRTVKERAQHFTDAGPYAEVRQGESAVVFNQRAMDTGATSRAKTENRVDVHPAIVAYVAEALEPLEVHGAPCRTPGDAVQIPAGQRLAFVSREASTEALKTLGQAILNELARRERE